MNRLSLERHVHLREGLDRPTGADEVVPLIDGTPLHEMVGDRSPGLAISFVAPPSRQWLGAPTYEEDGRAVVLDGSCGVAACCGVLAHITMSADTVVWSDFFARGLPPLPPGLHFEFDRVAYEATIDAVATAPERVWIVTDDEEP